MSLARRKSVEKFARYWLSKFGFLLTFHAHWSGKKQEKKGTLISKANNFCWNKDFVLIFLHDLKQNLINLYIKFDNFFLTSHVFMTVCVRIYISTPLKRVQTLDAYFSKTVSQIFDFFSPFEILSVRLIFRKKIRLTIWLKSGQN